MTTTRRCPVIGLIGGIGSGKSRVSAALARRGGRVISGDAAGHEALRQPEIKKKILARWGKDILGPDGEISRGKVGAIVFADPMARRELEAIVQPWIGDRLRSEIEKAQTDPAVSFVVLDAAVMLEAGWGGAVDLLVYVHTPRTARLSRIAAQRGWSPVEVAARQRAQMSLTEKAARADAAVDNSGPPEQLEPQLDRLLDRLVGNASAKHR